MTHQKIYPKGNSLTLDRIYPKDSPHEPTSRPASPRKHGRRWIVSARPLVCFLLLALAAQGLFCQGVARSTSGGSSASPNGRAPSASPQPSMVDRRIFATTATDYPVTPGDDRRILATTTADYPVTPGDVYRLTYVYSSELFSLPVYVDSDYRVNLSLFGDVDARALTLTQLRRRVEQIVLTTYPGSGPQLSLESVGVFELYVKGEVTAAGWIPAWGLSRLSSIVKDRMTPYSSTRDIEVISTGAEGTRYDLFQASRFGRKELDPYVGPRDTIVVHPRSREVNVVGEVERPGSYQLLPGENLEELLHLYGGGFTKLADAARIQITRWNLEKEATGETLYVNVESQPVRMELRDMDVVRVSSVKQWLPVVFFEGAIASAEGQSSTGVDTFNRIRYTFAEGELLSSAVKGLYARFGTGSDIEHAFVIRSDTAEKIPVDIRQLVQNKDTAQDLQLRPFDRIVIPYRNYVVTVSGAVTRPGQYPYMPDRSWRYYVEVAGGFDPAKHVGDAVVITDVGDKIQSESRIIEVEDKILVPTNNVFFFATPVVQIVGVLASVTTAIVVLLQLLK